MLFAENLTVAQRIPERKLREYYYATVRVDF